MRIHNVVQGTPEWLALRAGIPTASDFSKIVTPTGKLSKQSRDYKAFLLAERVMRAPIVQHVSAWMDRGSQFEDNAIAFYELYLDRETERIGFVTNDAGTIGASPDRWAGDEGQVEIKVPAPHTHFAFYLAQQVLDTFPDTEPNAEHRKEAMSNSLAQEYRVQTMGQLWITERRWADLLSYSPDGLPPVLVHLERDEYFIGLLARSVTEFSVALEEESARLVEAGIIQQ